jgi:tRNA(adenine34) deaminase
MMPEEHEGFMRLAWEEAARGGTEGNVAVGSVIVHQGTVVARGRNLVTTTADPIAHAETVALRNAGAALQRRDFSGYTLYTTYEPCPMCYGAMLVSGITTLVMGARPAWAERRWGDDTTESLIAHTQRSEHMRVVTGILVEACAEVRQVERR